MNGTILIADDDSDLVEIVAIRCKQIGFDVISVDNVEEAIIALECEQVDLAILDVHMPSLDGENVFGVLETRRELADLPVIILTGCKDDETIRQCHTFSTRYVCKGSRMWPRLKQAIKESLPRSCQPIQSYARHRRQSMAMG